MIAEAPDWLIVERHDAPLIVSIPHAGAELLGFEPAFVDPWLARKDADWRLDELYDFVPALNATVLRTRLSRSVIDVNRDPSGASLYPGQATTELVPTTTFDGEPLYRPGRAPDAAEIAERRRLYFDPYHAALASEIARLRQQHKRIALFDAHSIRSVIARLFDGELPVFNLGTNSGASCDPGLRDRVGAVLAASGQTCVVEGRLKGGWITRARGKPAEGVESLQLELACRAYMHEPERPAPDNWPTPIDEKRAAPTRATIKRVLQAILSEVSSSGRRPYVVIPDGSKASDRESSVLAPDGRNSGSPGTFGPPRMTSF
jgi:N-formylglutamate deformylase